MNPKSTPALINRILDNRLLASGISLALLIAGIATVSVPLLILSGVLAYGWPFLNIYLNHLAQAPKDKPAKLGSLRPSASIAS